MSYYDEIRQQPSVLIDFADYLEASCAVFAQQIHDLVKATDPDEIIFSGMGSSLFVSEIACTYLRRKGVRAFTLEANVTYTF